MKKTSVLFVCMIALVVFAAWAPNADAFNAVVTPQCLDCHDARNVASLNGPGATSHDNHQPRTGNNCQACHVQIGDIPESSTCGVCHTVPGIAVLHLDRNADPSCVNCHPAPVDPNDVDNDGDGVTENQGDCNDADASIFPGATEVCGDGIDQDCDLADEPCPPDPADVDNDGDGVTENEGDCDDTNASIFPGAPETCGDGIDQNCDGADEACPPDPNDVDNDGDGMTENHGDCDDGDASVYLGAPET